MVIVLVDTCTPVYTRVTLCTVLILLLTIIITGAVTRQPIPVAALSSHLERMHTNENCGFSEEYRVSILHEHV